MDEELLDKLRRINPMGDDGIPIHSGNCQWCAIEGARVLLQGVEPQEIPDFEGGRDAIEEYVHPEHGCQDLEDRIAFRKALKSLVPGTLMMVSLETEDLDHAYLIFKDQSGLHLIDPDRQVFVAIKTINDFLQPVRGWDDVETVNYLNGDVEGDEDHCINMSYCVLSKSTLESKPLPDYSSRPSDQKSLF